MRGRDAHAFSTEEVRPPNGAGVADGGARGRAEVDAGVYGCPVDFDWDDFDEENGEWPCDYDSVQRTIQLRGGPARAPGR